MSFNFYTNAVSRASKGLATAIFILGLALIGVGFLIYVLRDLFAILFSIIFCIAGVGCAITALRILWTMRKFGRINSHYSEPHRENVKIHIEEHYDV